MIAFHWKGAVVLHVSQTWHFLAFSIIFLFIIAGTCLQITVYRSDCLYQHTIFWNDSFAEDFLPVFFSQSLQPVGNLFYRFKLRLRLFSFWIWLTICWDQVSSQDSTLPVVENIMFIAIGNFSDLPTKYIFIRINCSRPLRPPLLATLVIDRRKSADNAGLLKRLRRTLMPLRSVRFIFLDIVTSAVCWGINSLLTNRMYQILFSHHWAILYNLLVDNLCAQIKNNFVIIKKN